MTAHAKPDVTIRVEHGNWGNADTADIKSVLESVADELLKNVSSVHKLAIIVRHDLRGPRTLYRREQNGEFVVWLNVTDRRWAQLAYQFGHELNHVLTINKKNSPTPNQWFEESVGEAASLYAIRKMADSWHVSPPYPNWQSYSGSLRNYVEAQIAEEHRKLPAGKTFIQWFKENEPSMRADPYLRPKDELVAGQLLGYFENYDGGWDAVSFINRTKPTSGQTFRQYLENWHRDAPARHRPFIKSIGELFGNNVR
ncbi:MAG: hypothetical protein R2681_07355 [Pyrinomonadaceae bacterium]